MLKTLVPCNYDKRRVSPVTLGTSALGSEAADTASLWRLCIWHPCLRPHVRAPAFACAS